MNDHSEKENMKPSDNPNAVAGERRAPGDDDQKDQALPVRHSAQSNNEPHESGPTTMNETPVTQPTRIWVLHCPFTKSGFPNLGNFGSTVRPVVILPLATWTKLCEDIPALATMQFEVGTAE